ncbi:MAG: type IV secretion system protein [Methylococcales bacterium]|nr:type IV secretion system protein [Methylococcales bacterium]
MKRDPELDKYLAEASSWEADKLRDALKQIKFQKVVIIGLVVVTGSLAWAIKGLTPLKTTQPYVVRVDNSTGIVDVVPIYNGEAELNELVTRNLLTHYQTARERYFYAIAETDYEYVGAFNNTKLNDEWARDWSESNSESPLVKYKDGTTVTVHVKGITFLEPDSGARDTAQIRFTTETRKGGNGAPVVTHWLSTVKYAYGEPSTNDKERSLNQLGLRITSYHKEPEVIAEQPRVMGGQP